MKIDYFYFLRRRKNTTESLISINKLDTEDKFKKFLDDIDVKHPESSVYQEAYKKVFVKKAPKKVENESSTADNKTKKSTTKRKSKRSGDSSGTKSDPS